MTGDKRAVRAIAGIAASQTQEKLACFEQVLLEITARSDVDDVRNKVCQEPKVDKTVSICFSCHSAAASERASILAGLESYIGDLRSRAADTLLRSSDLSALAP